MSTLFALLSQQNTNLQTRSGLIVLGMQNDFIAPNGKLPVSDTGFVDRLTALVSSFREHGDIIWVRSQFEDTRLVNGLDSIGDTVIAGGCSGQDPEVPFTDASPSRTSSSKKKAKATRNSLNASVESRTGQYDEELFLTRTAAKEPCCVRGSPGAEYAECVKPLIQQRDLQITKTHYSAFGATSLLLQLRSKLITDVYVCGCITNLSVYATAMDAARYGIRIILVEDCLGYRRKDRHDMAIHQLEEYMSAETMTSRKVLDELRGIHENEEVFESDDEDDMRSEHRTDRKSSPSLRHSNDLSGMIEVDSEADSDEEVSLPIVRPFTKLLHRKVELDLSDYSHATAGQRRISSSQHAKSSSPQPVSSRRSQPSIHREDKPEQRAAVKSNVGKASSHRKLDDRDSSPRNAEPWLDIITTTEAEAGERTQKPTKPRHPGLAALCSVAGLSSSVTLEYQNMMENAQEKQQAARKIARSKPLFGEEKEYESQSSRMLHDLLPNEEAESIFEELNAEVNWQTMHHQNGAVPRLVCCQATVDNDGNMPVYRHPSDQTLPTTSWTPVIDRVREAAEQAVGHPLNHALIQLYRSGNDYISEHSDKTLDIVPGSNIVNVSFGAQRTMRIRTKRGAVKADESPVRTTYRIPMPHNSMLVMSLRTNAEYLHAINWDRRPGVELSEAEKAFGGQRISITFRNIGTYLDKTCTHIWGQGATSRTRDEARAVINADAKESQRMIDAFGKENAASTIEYDEIYGGGFDVLHLR